MIFKFLGVLVVASLVGLGIDRALHLIRKHAEASKPENKIGRDQT